MPPLKRQRGEVVAALAVALFVVNVAGLVYHGYRWATEEATSAPPAAEQPAKPVAAVPAEQPR